ncbi:MAG: LPS export ABC transporter ATP-binding protein [Bdellovibrionota bacterium]|nr:LPS export ABC transporter ATP-binding protein [Pseudobdellovibrionaceae bacterium]MEC9281977.1 LPS export ABC transporter ATP-binding protein [Bdellovibrionota bacterium]|tara:strand:- start:4659 stop:5381 length:723 start_codon:yes stop_codon:yes gene_type:complete
MTKLVAEGLKKSYKGKSVVKNVGLEVDAGQVVGLLGPNGAGKTTSFYMVVGIIQPDAGKVEINGKDITNMPMYQRAQNGLGYLPQEASIFRKLTVEDNIKVALEAQGYSGQQKQEKLESLLSEFGMSNKAKSYGYMLSGGERRRVEIARSLACEPKYLLLDEPFAGIDPIAVGDIQEIIRHLTTKGIGILITDHNVRETLGICNHAYILKEGNIQVGGSPEEIANSEVARKFYLGENFRL